MDTVALNPVPGFCVKSRATNDAQSHLTASDQPRDIPVHKDLKIFVNIAWDPNVPPPPSQPDDVTQRAMHSLDSEDAWFVPIVLSDPRQDSDKAGQPAIVFDCVFNPSIKPRTLRDSDFKNFIIGIHSPHLSFPVSPLTIELAFQRIEQQTTLILSRQISTPNIASKGKPRSRRVLVPAALFPPGHPNRQAFPFIQEITDRLPNIASEQASLDDVLVPTADPYAPIWSWTQHDSSIRIAFVVPAVVSNLSLPCASEINSSDATQKHSNISACTLDVEPRRILLHAPALYDLDINLDSPDSELVSVFSQNDMASEVLKLKRMRSFDVDNARAEWRVADRAIILLA